ncbi:Dabb family protein [Luteolibacter sp. AS25]|uniref:Dabb family protein n=1 Tax=Luteolibacter sp. AS25 TaxID=3135776 RepID=UPI00398A872F
MEHHVYFWLKEEHQTAEARAEFEKGLDSLFTTPLCTGGRWSVPAPVMERPAVDNTWDYATVMYFDSVKEHDEYQVAPVHEAFIGGNKHRWTKVLVTDLA